MKKFYDPDHIGLYALCNIDDGVMGRHETMCPRYEISGKHNVPALIHPCRYA